MILEFTRFVIFLYPVQDTDTTEPLIRAHVRLFRELDRQGQYVMGGPFKDYPGGMMIIRAANLEEAQQIARNDPFVRQGVRIAEVRAWELSCEENNHMGMG